MSQTSQLYTLTPNVKTQITVTGQANRVRVVNDSSLYLRVYFGADAPIGANDPGWHDTISPGDKPLLWITGGTGQTWWAQSGNASSTPFTGVITFLPFIPAGALSPTGIVSGASILYITAFSPDETADRGGQTEAFVQAAKQGRLQSVAGAMPNTGGPSVSTDQTTATNTLLITSFGSLTPTVAPNLFAANAAGLSFVNFYIYYYQATMRSRSPALASVDYQLRAVVTDNGGVVRSGNAFLPVLMSAPNFGTDHFVFAPAYALVSRVGLAQNTLASGDLVGIEYQAGTETPQVTGAFDIRHVIYYTIDAINQTPLLQLAFPNNVFSSFPWNATYNPQTY